MKTRKFIRESQIFRPYFPYHESLADLLADSLVLPMNYGMACRNFWLSVINERHYFIIISPVHMMSLKSYII